MEQRVNKQNAKRNGKPFVVYGLICPITLEVKYVGQSIDLNHRNHGAWEPSLKQWAAICVRTASFWSVARPTALSGCAST